MPRCTMNGAAALLVAALSLSPVAALAQGAVLQYGIVVPGHVVVWGRSGVIMDGGTITKSFPFLPLTGGTLTGNLIVNGPGLAELDVAGNINVNGSGPAQLIINGGASINGGNLLIQPPSSNTNDANLLQSTYNVGYVGGTASRIHFNSVVDTHISSVPGDSIWNFLAQLSTTTGGASVSGTKTQVASYAQAVRNAITGGTKGVALEGSVTEYHDYVDQPSSVGGFGITAEFDFSGNNTDDQDIRGVQSIDLSQANASGSDLVVGNGIGMFGGTHAYLKRGIAINLPFSQAGLDMRASTQKAGANAIWLATNQTVALSSDGVWAIKSDGAGIEFLNNGGVLGYWDAFSNIHAPGGVTATGPILGNSFATPGNTLTLSGTNLPANQGAFAVNYNGTSTRSDNTSMGSLLVSSASDTAALSNHGSLQYILVASNVGTGWQGGRSGVGVQLNQTAATALANIQDGLVGFQSQVVGSFNAGGSATGFGVSSFGMGALYGANQWAKLTSGATDWNANIGQEVNASIASGASASIFSVQQLVVTSDHAAHGTNRDDGLLIGAQIGASAGLKNVVVIGEYDSQFPADANGILFQARRGENDVSVPAAAAGGLDVSQVDFTGISASGGGFAFKSQGFKVLNSGAVQAGFGSMDGSSGGLKIDAPYQQLTGTPTVSAGGANWTTNDLASDAYGDIVRVTASGGVVSAVSVIRQGFQSSPPSNPVTFNAMGRTGAAIGSGLTLTLAWTANQKIAFFGTTPVARPTITGVKSTMDAGAKSVGDALSALGLVTDSRT